MVHMLSLGLLVWERFDEIQTTIFHHSFFHPFQNDWCKGKDSNLSTFFLDQVSISANANLSFGLEVSHHGLTETPPSTNRMNLRLNCSLWPS
jgi:hypothetical protein